MNYLKRNVLPVISILSRFKHHLSVLFNKRKTNNYIIHFILEFFDDAARLSLASFLASVKDKPNLKVSFYCFDKHKSEVSNIIGSSHFDIYTFSNDISLFEAAMANALSSKKALLHGFIHAEAYFHRDWLTKTAELEKEVYAALTKKKTGALSTFNPNDFKVFKDITSSENFDIKDGFSFLCIFFYNTFLQRHKKAFQKNKGAENLMQLFKTYEYNAAFTKNSYVDSINRVSGVKAEAFIPKQNNLTFAKNPINDNNWHLDSNVSNIAYFKHKVLVIQVHYGGLGDHLFCSHLPRIAKETGRYQKVYISKKSDFRQEATKYFVWELNPYIDGFCDEPGYSVERFFGDFKEMNILDKIMLLHNLDDQKRFHEPELYHTPKIKKELVGKVIFDPNYIADSGDRMTSSVIDDYFLRNGIKVDFQMTPKFKNVTANNFSDWLKADSLEDFINIIASCKAIYCFATGTATLACAIKKKAHVFYNEGFNKQFLHSKNNIYIKI